MSISLDVLGYVLVLRAYLMMCSECLSHFMASLLDQHAILWSGCTWIPFTCRRGGYCAIDVGPVGGGFPELAHMVDEKAAAVQWKDMESRFPGKLCAD